MAGNDPLPLPEFTENLTLVRKDENAKQRLAELSGLTLDVFEEALFSGHSGSARSTASHAKNAAGTYRWHETLAALRSALTSQQWEQRDEKNAPRIVSPDGKIALMVATGNAKTGTKDNPSNATSKGIMTQLDVWNNDESQQMVIEEIAKLISSTSPKTWMLLYFYSERYNHIRAELSQPTQMQGGFVTKWEERIILPTIELGTADMLSDAQPDETPEIDFEIGNADAV